MRLIITEAVTAVLGIFITYLFNRFFTRVFGGAHVPAPADLGEGQQVAKEEGVQHNDPNLHHNLVHWSTGITEVPIHIDQTKAIEEEFVVIDHTDTVSVERTILDDVSRVVGRPSLIPLLRLFAILGAINIGFANNFLGGVFSMGVFFLRTDPTLYNIQELAKSNNYCQYYDKVFLIMTSIVPICSIFTGWVAIFLSNRYGRKCVAFLACLLMILGTSLVLTLPRTPTVAGLIFIGCGAGLYSRIVPTICSESVPTDLQRHFSVLCGYQVSGAALASVVNFIAAYDPEKGWRLPFIVLGTLSTISAGVTYLLEETPVYFIEKGRYLDALGSLIRLRHQRMLRDVTLELDQLRDDTLEATQKNGFRELLQDDHFPTFLIQLASSVLPLLMSTVPVIFFGPLVTISMSKSVPRVPFLISLVGGLAGLVVTLLKSLGLPTLKHRRMLIGSTLLGVISLISLFAIFLIYLHAEIVMKMGPSLVTAFLMVMNYVAVTVLSPPQGWINTSLGAGGSVGSLTVASLSSVITVIKNCYSVKLVCDIGAWGFLLDWFFGVLCLLFVYAFVPESVDVLPTTAA